MFNEGTTDRSPVPDLRLKRQRSHVLTHIDEIPYFGEHTQVTILCHACNWRQTDFIPAEGKKAGAWSMTIDSADKLSARVVRSLILHRCRSRTGPPGESR